ncbi:MAG: hypothetical protein BA863_07600 [Desulfovibrio sp. S3730MH75]|nr:MAG: hypothetical protein BA863_07600 [Desulfovibrio sp. S3730MH75]
MSSENELIKLIINYANLVIGFAVAQSMVFLFAIGKDITFRDRIIIWRKKVIRFFLASGLIYLVIVIYLGRSEVLFRKIAEHSKEIITFSISAVIGRMLILVLFGFICIYATKKIGTKDRAAKDANNNIEKV